MAGLSVIELWGVATRLTKRLNGLGIHSILDLPRADPVRIRDRFSVVLMRTVLELQGTPCIPLEKERIGRDQLISSRSFASPITTGAGIRQMLGVYAQQASARLARHGLQAKVLTAFAATSYYNPQASSYPPVCVPLPMPTADPVLLARAAHALLPRIDGGVKGSIGLGHAGIRGGPDWSMKRDVLSPGTRRIGQSSPSSRPRDCPAAAAAFSGRRLRRCQTAASACCRKESRTRPAFSCRRRDSSAASWVGLGPCSRSPR